jgi:predicted RNA-binding Zn-ribbon protein involved in translation (DUF1610 family)
MTDIPEEKMKMMAIVIGLRELTDPVALQSVIDAATMRKKELDEPVKLLHDQAKVILENMDDDKAVKFVCSDCGHTRLEAVLDGPHTTIIEGMCDSGGVEYGDTESEGYLERFQCVGCGKTIKDVADEPIKDDEELVEWCKENCNQE